MHHPRLFSAALAVLLLAAPALAQTSNATNTVTLSVPNVAGFSGSGNGPYDETQDVNGYRAAGSNCATTGSLSYSVTQGTSQTVNFQYASNIIVIGGSYNGQFLATGDGCSVTATSASVTNPVNSSTITSITFAPTVAVCGEFVDNSVGNLALIAFDTSSYISTDPGYTVYACKFTLTFTLVPESTSSVDPSQLFPEANAADPLPGSFLKMLVMAVAGGGLMLFMLL